MRALSFLFILFTSLSAQGVTLHGRLLAKGNKSIFVYAENGREKEVELTKSLDEFRGQKMTITGFFRDNYFLVESALTDENSLIRGKRGRGFKGIATIVMDSEPLLSPLVNREVMSQIKGRGLRMKMPAEVPKPDKPLAIVDVTGVIANGEIDIFPGFDGFRVRQEFVEVKAGDTLVIDGKLFNGEPNDSSEWEGQSFIPADNHPGEFRVQPYQIFVMWNGSEILQPAYTEQALYGTVVDPAIREFVEPNEDVRIFGKIDASGHIAIEIVEPDLRDIIFSGVDAEIPVAKESCESAVAPPKKEKPKLRLIKKDEE